MMSENTLNLISDCWVVLGHLMHVNELDSNCRHVICIFLLKIKEDDRDLIDHLDLREDVEFCEKFERKTVPGVIQ
ncbi:hypothetical protein SACC_00120 [Saccharolobus caldissimus]|uniref:Uncharacterized protein n=2 Tax=Saccharolobus caldissimus TaxID=1702097 RepID=A0AAQ4CMG4_9CREN|nr:hypothetical protein SACC_00120 [Saccharolobus caldissimus]